MNRLFAIGCFISLAFSLAGCNKPAEPKPVVPGATIEGQTITFTKDSPQIAALRSVPAQADRETYVRINGRLSWDESRTVRIFSPMAGRVADVNAQLGQAVQQGQALLRISAPDFGVVQAEARKADIDWQQAQKNLARVTELVQAGVAPQKDLQFAQTELARATTERDRALARQKALGASANTVDQSFVLRAPIAGVVVERKVNVGQELGTDTAPESILFLISDPKRLWVSLDVPEALTQEIAPGESIRVLVPALPGEVFEAKIDYVADAIDPQTRTVKARASVSNLLRRLKAEMYVTADVEVPSSAALRVPATALFLIGANYYAFVEDTPGRYTRRVVKAEEASLGQMRVTAGLALNDQVVADGALLLQQMLNQKATAPNK
jgi:membrane fusion protein, heavy metal efflux system